MTERIVLRQAAVADLRDTFNWYQHQQPGLGTEFMQAVD